MIFLSKLVMVFTLKEEIECEYTFILVKFSNLELMYTCV